MSTESLAPVAAPTETQKAFRSEVAKISRQSLIFMAGTFFTLGGGYLFKIYTARVLGAEGLGLYALGISVISITGLFCNLGIPRALVRFVPGYLAKGEFGLLGAFVWWGLLLVGTGLLASAIIAVVRDWIAVQFFHKPELAPVLGLLAITVLLSNVTILLDQLLVGFQKTAVSKSISSFLVFPLTVVLAVVLITLGWGLTGYIIAGLVASVIGLAVMAGVAWRLLPPAARRPQFHHFIPAEATSYSAYVMGMGVIDYAASGLDNILVGIYLVSSQVGIYSVGMVAASFVSMLLGTVNTIFAPLIVEMRARREPELLERLLQALTKWTTALTIPVFLVLTIFASEFLAVFGADFTAGQWVLILLAFGQMVNVATGSCGYMLLMSGQHRPVLYVKLLLAIIAPVLYLLLIPTFGITGAALVGLLAASISNFAWVVLVWHYLKMLPYNRSFTRLLIPLSGATVTIWVLHQFLSPVGMIALALSLLGALIAGYIVFAVIWLLVGLDRDDRFLLDLVGQRIRRTWK